MEPAACKKKVENIGETERRTEEKASENPEKENMYTIYHIQL